MVPPSQRYQIVHVSIMTLLHGVCMYVFARQKIEFLRLRLGIFMDRLLPKVTHNSTKEKKVLPNTFDHPKAPKHLF